MHIQQECAPQWIPCLYDKVTEKYCRTEVFFFFTSYRPFLKTPQNSIQKLKMCCSTIYQHKSTPARTRDYIFLHAVSLTWWADTVAKVRSKSFCKVAINLMNTCRVTIKDMFTFSRGPFWRKHTLDLLLLCSSFSQSFSQRSVCVCVGPGATSHKLAPNSLQLNCGENWKLTGKHRGRGGYYTT